MRRKQTRNSTNGSRSAGPDAIRLLKADHATVKKLFKQFEKTDDEAVKQELAATICNELTVHTTIEEEIFYPAAREAIDDEDLLDEAKVEHASAKELIAQIEGGSPDDDLWEAKVTVLGEYINHHVKEEQDELFPQVKKSGIDLKELGQRLEARKVELTGAQPSRRSKASNSSSRKEGARSARAGA